MTESDSNFILPELDITISNEKGKRNLQIVSDLNKSVDCLKPKEQHAVSLETNLMSIKQTEYIQELNSISVGKR